MEDDTQQMQAQLGSQRTLTVSSLFRQWGDAHRKNECIVPSIRLNGKWLASLGFVSGQKIRVITNGAIITLAPVSFATTENERASGCPASLNPGIPKPPFTPGRIPTSRGVCLI